MVLVTLLLISAMIALILAIAWRDFDRPRHALTWAIAFTLVAASWAVPILQWLAGLPATAGVVATALAAASAAAMAVGFRQRAGMRPWTRGLLGGGAIVVLAYALLTRAGILPGVREALPVLFTTVTTALAASSLTGRRAGERAAERTTMAVLVVLALFHVATAALALLAERPGGAAYLELFYATRLLVLPAALTGTGLFALFLLAADLGDRMLRLAASDPLTGILNRRGFEEAAGLLLASARRQGRPVSLVLADIDRFKRINDDHGHAAGDHALQLFAGQIGASVRRRDLFGRIGGEEFAIILPDIPSAVAVERMTGLCRTIAAMQPAGLAQGMTASFGITEFRPADDDLWRMMVRADRALYRSKQDGRNRVSLDEGREADP